MSVQLLPFQKLVDMPNLAQRHRRTIFRLAIASIVLIFIILCILVPAFIAGFAMSVYSTSTLFTFVGIPSMVIILILVCTSGFISLRNTDRWASTDTCCNLMRSNPTCCTKCCDDNKHCCARMSCLHIAASVWTSLFCVLLVVLLFAGCNESDSITRAFESKYPSRRPARSLQSLDNVPYKWGIRSSAAWRSYCVGDGTECKGLCGAGYTLITTRDDCEAAVKYLRETSASIKVRVYHNHDDAVRGCSVYGSRSQTNPAAPVQFGSKFDQLYSDSYSTPICVRATKAPPPTCPDQVQPRCPGTFYACSCETCYGCSISNKAACNCLNCGCYSKCPGMGPCIAGKTAAPAKTTTQEKTAAPAKTTTQDTYHTKYGSGYRDYHYGSEHRYKTTPERKYRDYHYGSVYRYKTTPERKYRDYHYGSEHRYKTTPERRDDLYSWERHQYESSKHACSVLAGFEVPAIALMICLAITTATAARLLRKIEQAQPEIELLPAGKLVIQTCEYAVPDLIKENVIEDAAQVKNDVNSTPGSETEQNE